mmetsp:Transcript_147967/g.368749  ORF Transcript_147967/g.368749 Transcript_147967/m.368749 type:complete len:554 (-) Transcript_147967:10-1671(-)
MPCGLRPSGLYRAEDRLLLWRVIQQWQEDRARSDASLGHEDAFGHHVPVLGDEVGVPATHGRGEEETQGVAREGHVAIDRVRQASQLVQRSEEARCADQKRLRQVILEVHDWRLPDGEVPLRLRALEEVVSQGLEIVFVQLGIIIDHGDDNSGVVLLKAMLGLEFFDQLIERPALVRGLPWQVPRQVGRVESGGDEFELLLVLLDQRGGLLVATNLTLLKGQAHAHVGPGIPELLQGADRGPEDFEGRLICRYHHHMEDIVPLDVARACSRETGLGGGPADLRARRLAGQPGSAAEGYASFGVFAVHAVPIVSGLDPASDDSPCPEDHDLPTVDAHIQRVEQQGEEDAPAKREGHANNHRGSTAVDGKRREEAHEDLDNLVCHPTRGAVKDHLLPQCQRSQQRQCGPATTQRRPQVPVRRERGLQLDKRPEVARGARAGRRTRGGGGGCGRGRSVGVTGMKDCQSSASFTVGSPGTSAARRTKPAPRQQPLPCLVVARLPTEAVDGGRCTHGGHRPFPRRSACPKPRVDRAPMQRTLTRSTGQPNRCRQGTLP